MNKQTNILIVDDDPQIIKLMSIILSREGYIIHSANSGTEALTLLKDQHVDILLTDYSMPQMNGVELIRETRKTHQNLIIFMITAYSAEYISRYGSEEGIQKVLTKPVNINSLRSLLSTAINT